MQVMKKEMIEGLLFSMHRTPDVKDSLKECYGFFKKFVPLDLISLNIYNLGQDALRLMAVVTDEEVMLINELIPLSADSARFTEKEPVKKIRLSTADEARITRDIAAHFGIFHEKRCSLNLTAEISPFQYFTLGLSARGENRYHENHADMMRAFYEPLSTIARDLCLRIKEASLKERLTAENQELRRKLGFLGDPLFLDRESGLKEVIKQVEQVAPVDSPVLIMGETGSGKEVVADAIHRRSGRADKPFISVNCGAIPDTLLDSELFGYEKGAFTGASGMKRGYFEQADEGTIFLDEVSELSFQAQVKLLRLLQTMQFQRVGGSRPISINVRVLAATNRDLQVMIKEQKFRRDLWFRLNVFLLRVPSLRERKEDIPVLAERFVHRKSAEMNLPFSPVFTEGAIEQLQAYDWPGNVRELHNVLERALILSQGNPLSFPNLDPAPNGAWGENSYDEGGRILTLDELNAQHIQKCLVITRGQIGGPTGAAALLGLNPSTLRGKMRKLGIQIKHQPEHQRLKG